TGAQGSFAVITAARGKFVYTADAQVNGNVYGFMVDPVNGALSAIPGSPFEAGNTPNALIAEESNRFLFVTNNIEVLGSPTQTFGKIQSFSVLLNGGLNSLGLPVDDSATANA